MQKSDDSLIIVEMTEQKIAEELTKISQSIKRLEHQSSVLSDWWPKKRVMNYFDLGETQMRVIEKKYSLVCSKIGSKKFYSAKSILKVIEKNKNQ
jgi:hypothetical protein